MKDSTKFIKEIFMPIKKTPEFFLLNEESNQPLKPGPDGKYKLSIERLIECMNQYDGFDRNDIDTILYDDSFTVFDYRAIKDRVWDKLDFMLDEYTYEFKDAYAEFGYGHIKIKLRHNHEIFCIIVI